jgi:hypothetical protein
MIQDVCPPVTTHDSVPTGLIVTIGLVTLIIVLIAVFAAIGFYNYVRNQV